jgi:hypothetical protein
MAKKILNPKSKDDASSSSSSYATKSRNQHRVHPTSARSESNLPRMMAFQSPVVNFAPNGNGNGGQGQVTMLKNKVFYRSRSDFRQSAAAASASGEHEARV